MEKVNMTETNMTETNITETNMTETNITETNMTESSQTDQQQHFVTVENPLKVFFASAKSHVQNFCATENGKSMCVLLCAFLTTTLFLSGFIKTYSVNLLILYFRVLELVVSHDLSQEPQFIFESNKKFLIQIVGSAFFWLLESVMFQLHVSLWFITRLISGLFYFQLLNYIVNGKQMTVLTQTQYESVCKLVCFYDNKYNIGNTLHLMTSYILNSFSVKEWEQAKKVCVNAFVKVKNE